MKKLLLLVAVVMVFGVGTTHAQQYEVAPCGTKNFTTAADVVPGGIICLDIYLTGVGAPQNAGGAWLDFSDSVADIAYVSGGRCLTDGSEGCTGPWDPAGGVLVNEPAGVGTVMYVVSASAAAPDGDGDLIVGTVTLQNTGSNDATVNITCIPPFCSWTPIVGSDVVPGSIVISQNTDPDEDGIPHLEDNCPNTSNPDQLDQYPPQGNDIGDACDCESDFNCDGNVDAADVTSFLNHFGRSTFFNPCTNADPCYGDFDCNVNVDADDVTKFLEDFGRSQFFNPCPACVAGDWCVY